jgi:hypothetical protein
MDQVIFLKTFIPKRDFKETFEIGNMMVRHLGAVFDEEIEVYSCYECSVPISLFDENKVQRAFEEFQSKLKASELATAKSQKITEIESYDTSPSVNGFMLNRQKVWLDFELRDRVYQGNERLQRIGRTDTTLWLGNQCYNLSIEQAQNIISHIEAYAKDCYNVTAAHKAAVEKLQTVEEVEAYDYTQGYPEQLEMEV